jgi:DMSO/TMAO reductase YedYZ molybdopterin-dependent catalytic subunit
MPTPWSSGTDELVVLATSPLVAESPLERQVEPLTPTPRFFIRSHFGTPAIPTEEWQLAIGGAVTQARTVTLADLQRLPARHLDATMECAGNGRSFLPPPTEGNQFSYGAVSAARWTGVPVHEVLEPAGLAANVCEILFVGADRGFERNVGREIAFERSLPIEIARHPDTLLVYEMNGAPLSQEHGGPIRLLVPGWYGVASVKWLVELRALTQPFDGYFQVQRYVMPNGEQTPVPLRERRVRAVITDPAPNATVLAGPVEVRGLAWSGNQPVTRVELSVDGGASWGTVALDGAGSPYAWQHWHTTWEAAVPGDYLLHVRASDAAGRTQPAASEWNLLGYANNGIQSLPVRVARTLP